MASAQRLKQVAIRANTLAKLTLAAFRDEHSLVLLFIDYDFACKILGLIGGDFCKQALQLEQQ